MVLEVLERSSIIFKTVFISIKNKMITLLTSEELSVAIFIHSYDVSLVLTTNRIHYNTLTPAYKRTSGDPR